MTVADQVLATLRGDPAGLTDSELATLLGQRHPHTNMTCRSLADQGLIVWNGSRASITNRLTGDALTSASAQTVFPPPAAPSDDWSWEGNVQSAVVSFLAKAGWRIVSVADTARCQQGTDVIAEREGSRLLVEVKGRPSSTYARGERAGPRKPTQPSTQAGIWFAQGLTTLIRRGAEPQGRLAVTLPDKPRYRTLFAEAGWALRRLDVAAYLVAADGSVQTWEGEG